MECDAVSAASLHQRAEVADHSRLAVGEGRRDESRSLPVNALGGVAPQLAIAVDRKIVSRPASVRQQRDGVFERGMFSGRDCCDPTLGPRQPQDREVIRFGSAAGPDDLLRRCPQHRQPLAGVFQGLSPAGPRGGDCRDWPRRPPRRRHYLRHRRMHRRWPASDRSRGGRGGPSRIRIQQPARNQSPALSGKALLVPGSYPKVFAESGRLGKTVPNRGTGRAILGCRPAGACRLDRVVLRRLRGPFRTCRRCRSSFDVLTAGSSWGSPGPRRDG